MLIPEAEESNKQQTSLMNARTLSVTPMNNTHSMELVHSSMENNPVTRYPTLTVNEERMQRMWELDKQCTGYRLSK